MKRGSNNLYSRDFREQAMNLVRVEGRLPMVVARELGMPFSTLFAWLKRRVGCSAWSRQRRCRMIRRR